MHDFAKTRAQRPTVDSPHIRPLELGAQHPHPERQHLRCLPARSVAVSEFISVHAPLTPETHHSIGVPELRAMKPTAYIINTARGPLIDEYALARAIDKGWIAGAGIDVLEQELPPRNHPLIGLERAIVTPHVAFLSEESLLELERRAALSVVRVLQGRMPEYVWNREVLERVSLAEE